MVDEFAGMGAKDMPQYNLNEDGLQNENIPQNLELESEETTNLFVQYNNAEILLAGRNKVARGLVLDLREPYLLCSRIEL